MKILRNQDFCFIRTNNYIPVLMASTGSNLEAEIAGTIPEINPITAARLVPKIMFPTLRKKSKSKALVKTMDISQTKNKPIIPPITERIIASNKNCSNINLFLAPNDF